MLSWSPPMKSSFQETPIRNNKRDIHSNLITTYTNIMHYKNGREAHENDQAIFPLLPKTMAGTLHSFDPNSTCCNAILTVASIEGVLSFGVQINQGFHAEDAFAAAQIALERGLGKI